MSADGQKRTLGTSVLRFQAAEALAAAGAGFSVTDTRYLHPDNPHARMLFSNQRITCLHIMVPSKVPVTKRHWRTRSDPFSKINDEIQGRLEENPFLSGKQVFNEFQTLYPGKFEDKLLRTFQRRIESWRKAKNSVECTKAWTLALLQGKIELIDLKNNTTMCLLRKI